MKKRFSRKNSILMILATAVMLLLCTSPVFAATVTKAQARQIALKTASVQASQVTRWIKVKLDNWDDDRTREWDVEFRTATYRYEMEINARTGRVEDFEKKKVKTSQNQVPTPSTPSTTISEAQAKTAALNAAGVKSADVREWTKTFLDGNEWELVFKTATTRYEVDVNAFTGAVKDFEQKALPQNTTPGTTITQEQAQNIALNHAKQQPGVSGDPTSIRTKLDRDDGRVQYEVDIRFGWLEFEYEIDSTTGAILKWDMDYDD